MAHKENSGEKKKKEEKPDISKDEGQARIRQGGEGGRVTLRSIEQGNTIKVVRSPEAWRDANPVFHSSSPSLSFLRFRETSTRASRKSIPLFKERVPRFEIKHLASRPPACVRLRTWMHASRPFLDCRTHITIEL